MSRLHRPDWSSLNTHVGSAESVAIDPSGDIWVTNYGGSKIVEVIGAAAPMVTPLSTAANAGTLGTLP